MAMLRIFILAGVLLVIGLIESAAAPPCESVKSQGACEVRGGCAWVNVSQGQGKGKGNTMKCRTLKPSPR